MRIVCVSDTHGGHRRLEPPDGDVLLIGGDVTDQGTVESLREFDDYLGTLDHEEIVLVAGNHDTCFEDHPVRARHALTNARYLEDESTHIAGVRIYGSPWQPRLVETETSIFAFDLPRGAPLAERWEAIPDATDVLVTHTPPQGVRDEIYTGDALGCRALRTRLEEVDPDLHVFGHVHEQPGVTRADTRCYVNAATPGGYGSVTVLDRASDGTIDVVDPGDWLPDWIRERIERKARQHREG